MDLSLWLNFLGDIAVTWLPLLGAVGITGLVIWFVVFVLCK